MPTQEPSLQEPSLIEILAIDEALLNTWAAAVQDWIVGHLLSVDTAIQIGVVIAAMIVGAVAGRIAAPKISAAIEALRLPMGLRKTLQNLRRLSGAILTLALLFAAMLGHAAIDPPISFAFVDAMMRLCAAWIIIRMAVQVVHNPMARSIIAGLVWIITALSIFGMLDDVARALDGLGITLGEFRLSALTLTKATLVTLILLYGASALSKLIEHQLGKIPTLAPGPRLLIAKIARIFLMTLAILIGATLAGVNLAMLAVFSGAVGLGVGLGLQRGISNLFTGMMLLLDRTIEPGNIIEMPDGTLGRVHHMGSRCTELRSLDNRAYLIPNEELVARQVINWSRGSTEVSQSVTFGVDYKHNPHDIIKLAVDATRGIDRVIREPICQFTGFGDSSLNFVLRFWINDPENGTGGVKSAILLALWDAFDKNGIDIPYPHRTLVQKAVS